MLNEHAKIMRCIEVAGEIIGRKKLQKIVYIAKRMRVDFDERFEFHMYGPYSEELTQRVEDLCHLGMLQEMIDSKGAIQTYRYSLTEGGKEFLQYHNVQLNGGERIITRLNEENSRFLELISTILYFDQLPKEQIRVKIETLKSKQKYTSEEIDQGFAYLDELKRWMDS